MEESEINDFLSNLTARERKILALVADGLTSKEIAQKLNSSERTVQKHREHIYLKANVAGTQPIRQFVWTVKPYL
jgi:DNA-binding NarL/FixJ family response regulator